MGKKSMTNVTENSKEKTLDSYFDMLECDYDGLVTKLGSDNGSAKRNYYYTKQSIENFYKFYENGKKDNNSGNQEMVKLVRTSGNGRRREGLELHHTFENKYSNLTNLKKLSEYVSEPEIKLNDFINFQSQSNLIYVNPVEHIILHTLIPMRNKNGACPMRFGDLESAYDKNKIKKREEKEGKGNGCISGPAWINKNLSEEDVRKLSMKILNTRIQVLQSQLKEVNLQEYDVSEDEISTAIGKISAEIKTSKSSSK